MLSKARLAFVAITALGVGTMFLSAPSGGFLLASPPREPVKHDASNPSVRRGSRTGGIFIWAGGGGYRGGK